MTGSPWCFGTRIHWQAALLLVGVHINPPRNPSYEGDDGGRLLHRVMSGNEMIWGLMMQCLKLDALVKVRRDFSTASCGINVWERRSKLGRGKISTHEARTRLVGYGSGSGSGSGAG